MKSNTNKGVIPKATRQQPTNTKRMQRTPPSRPRVSFGQNTTSDVSNESIYQCVVCLKADNVNKICCDGCNLWSHFTCAKITNEMLTRDQWFCQNCQAKKQQSFIAVNTTGPAGAPSNNVTLNVSSNPIGTNVESPIRSSPDISTATNVITASASSAVPPIVTPFRSNVAIPNEPSSAIRFGSNVAIQTQPSLTIPIGENVVSATNANIASTIQPILATELNAVGGTVNMNRFSYASTMRDNQTAGHRACQSQKSKSIKSTTSSSKRKNLALQRLEEEQKLKCEREKEERERRVLEEKEYLDKKYAILAEVSDDSLSFDDYDETLNRYKIDPKREAEIDQWVRRVAYDHPSDDETEQEDNVTNNVLNVAPRHSSTNVFERKQIPNLAKDGTKVVESWMSRPYGQHANYAPRNPAHSSSLPLFMPSSSTQFNLQSSRFGLPASSAQSNILSITSQAQIVVPNGQSAVPVNHVVVSNNQLPLEQRRSQPHLPDSMTNSTFIVNHPFVSAPISDNQPVTTSAHMHYTPYQRPIMSSYQQIPFGQMPSSQNYQPTNTHQPYQQQMSSMSTFGPPIPTSAPMNHQSMYNYQQVPAVPNQIGNPFSQHCSTLNCSSVPSTSGPNVNLNANSTANPPSGTNMNLIVPGNQSMINGSVIRHLTAEQIAARHVVQKDLPKFYGDPEDWLTFFTEYDSSTAVCGFNNYENLGRIRKALKGEAEEAVKSLLVHPNAVPEIMRTLFVMYGRPEFIIEKMINEIQREPAPKENELASIMKFGIKVRNLSRTIYNTGALEHLRNPILVNTITDKLPAQMQLNWAYHKQAIGVTDLTTLGNWLSQISEAASLVVRSSFKTSSRKKDQRDKKDNGSSSNYVNTHVESTTKNSQSPTDKEKKCPACKNGSCTKIANCKKFKELNRNERTVMIKENKLCSRCLGEHHFYRCRSNFKCKVDGCSAKHHTMLHDHEKTTDSSSKYDNKSKSHNDENGIKNLVDKFSSNASHSNVAISKQNQRIDKFRIVPIIVSSNGKSVNDFAYLDDGSNMTSMETSLANELDVKGTTTPICVDWAFGHRHTFDSKIVSVRLAGCYDGAEEFELNNVRTVNELHLPTQSITSSWLQRFDHLNRLPISTYESAKPRMLIGLQYSRLMVSLKTVEGNPDEPVACRTRLGWVIQGPSYKNGENSARRYSMNICECQLDDNNLHQLVKDYFQSENLGVKMPSAMLESKDTQRAKHIMESTTSKVDGRYETGLLWKYDQFELPNSYPMALKRLQCLETKMAKDSKLADNLRNQIREFVDKKYIRKLTPEELQATNQSPIWYLPTFPAFNQKKPEKVRIVWDGAAKVMNISINSLLLTGPDQLAPLPDILRKFRERLYAFMQEMYHQIKVIEADQNVQRFLWRDGDQSKEPDVYVMLVVTFGLTCSPSQAQFVKNKNALEFIKQYPEAVDTIINKHYVDDMLDCEHTIDAAEKRIREVTFIHKEGGFEIRNFLSNSKELLSRIGETSEQSNKNMNISIELGTERVLGMFWNAAADSFTFSLKYTKINEQILSGKHHPTKREVLRVLMSVFDPLGLLAHFLIHTKILLQEIWRTKVDWDEKITQPNLEKWIKWIRRLPDVEHVHIPRLYSPKLSPKPPKSIQMHTFVDASCEAYATTVYFRFEDEDGVDCSLASAKTKVAPNKPMSMPRLELQGAVLGTRLANSVKSSQTFTIDKVFYWTDSLTVMGWINSEARKFNQFVAFRIGEILESTDPNEWRWVPTDHNVADEATKSKEIAELESSSRWYKAPDFLYEKEEAWFNDGIDHTTEEEIRPSFSMAHREVVRDELIDLTRFSQWNRLVRTQAYVFRFSHNIRHKTHNRRNGPLQHEEIKSAENHLYRRAQMEHFLDEIVVMRQNQRNSVEQHREFERSSILRTYSPYLDEHDVIRMKGRIDAAEALAYDTKRPIILPRKHRITQLVVDHYHRRYKHANHATALNEIRQKYAIPALRVVMKGIRTSCQKCKNLLAEPKIPEMAELPPGRLATYTLPYTYVGLDYFGPLRVRNGTRKTRNRPVVVEKRWVLLFTCLTTRAIWMEIAHSLNTDSCIMCIDNFMLRKGQPREMHSDNGSSFHSSEKELIDEFTKMDQKVIEEKYTNSETVWKFNPPATPHMGGVWERLIRTVKTCLKETMKTRTPTDEMLKNLIVEAEYIVNSRPLTYVSLESADEEALTPNHILLGSSNGVKPLSNINERDLARNTYKAVQVLANNFWRRFVLEYMPTLTKRTKWFKPVEPIKVGDVVVIVDENSQRNSWPKGIVETLLPGKRGIIRQVMVRTANGIRKRSVGKLAVLDVKPPSIEMVNQNPMGSINGEGNVTQQNMTVNTDPQHYHSATKLPDSISTK